MSLISTPIVSGVAQRLLTANAKLQLENDQLRRALNEISQDELREGWEHGSYEDSYWRVVNIARTAAATPAIKNAEPPMVAINPEA